MVARRAPSTPRKSGGNYFPAEEDEGPLDFVPSGCTVLDCVLGGGWPLGRIANVVGDKAVGKTLLAIEACANFAQRFPRGHIWYREAEAAFDVNYARELGLPVDRVDFGPEGTDSSWDTIEDIADDVEKCAAIAKKSGQPGLYIIDSLDAVSSRAELDRKAGEGTYGLEKQKELGRIFRKYVRILRDARVAMIVISQIRDKIGITFGEKHTRTGGKALDFYASQILWLYHKANLKSTVKGIERVTAVRIRAKCKKNKIALSHRECEFVLRFGYGADDFEASTTFLTEVGMLNLLQIEKKDIPAWLAECRQMEGGEKRARRLDVAAAVVRAWDEVEDRFRPRQRKYG